MGHNQVTLPSSASIFYPFSERSRFSEEDRSINPPVLVDDRLPHPLFSLSTRHDLREC